MLPALCKVASAIKDSRALGGFGPSDNLPKKIRAAGPTSATQWYLLAEPDVVEKVGNMTFMRLCIVNRTAGTLIFNASDSRLSIVQEAVDDKGDWCPIEYLTSSWCGNSAHRVMLPAGQFWSIPTRRYQGSIKTKLRFRFDLPGQTVCSNEFEGSVHPAQFTEVQPRRPTNIMDPTFEVPAKPPTEPSTDWAAVAKQFGMDNEPDVMPKFGTAAERELPIPIPPATRPLFPVH